MNRIQTLGRNLLDWRVWSHALFWSWNLIFVAFMLFGFAPTVLPEVLRGVRDGTIPAPFFAYGVVITLIPVLAMIVGFVWLRRDPARLFAFAYAVEGPLMLLLVVRFFIVRQVTPAIALLLTIALLGLATLLWRLLTPQPDTQDERRPLALRTVNLFGMSLLLVISLYAAVWILFYVVPFAAMFLGNATEILGNFIEGLRAIRLEDLRIAFQNLREFLAESFLQSLAWIAFSVLGFILFVFTATLVGLMPLAVPIIVVRAWRRSLAAVTSQRAAWQASLLPATAVVALALVFVLAAQQPQQRAFDLLIAPPENVGEASALLDEREQIREGLLNAYLAPQRYIGAHGDIDHIRYLYEDAFNLARERAESVQRVYEAFISPLLYRPVRFELDDGPMADALDLQTAQADWRFNGNGQDALPAAQLYETFFDEDIIDGERDTVVNAVRTTWDVNRAADAWRAVDDREVLLLEQAVTIREQGDWAEVELYEVYQNQTMQQQEVVYYFTLPESAAITGVWLGNSADRNERFTHRVAPRGAAQQTYRNQVRRQIDPALVEQIGPQQYRLRIFPIEPQMWVQGGNTSREIDEGMPLHMWLTYRVFAEQNDTGSMSGWPLPRLSELRNVYWTDGSERLLHIERDGERIVENELLTSLLRGEAGASSNTAGDNDRWLPAHVWMDPVTPQAHTVTFGDSTVVARPASADDPPALPSDLRLAVVLDRSRSMVEQEEAALDALWQLTELAPQSDLFLTASPFRGEAPEVAMLGEYMNRSVGGDLLYYGGQNPSTLLAQFVRLADAPNDYDAILVLTDGSSYEPTPDGLDLPVFDAPLWLIHLGNQFPPGYDDAVLERIQSSGGGTAGDLQTALTRLAASQASSADIVDGYLWQDAEDATASDAVSHEADDPFAALAARRLILSEMQAQRANISDLDTLDSLHQVATEQSIVTPYSSMIVLVNSAQHRMLDDLENDDDRFEREFEDVDDTNAEDTLAVTAVPEPEEWLLIALAVGMLGWYVYRSRREGKLSF